LVFFSEEYHDDYTYVGDDFERDEGADYELPDSKDPEDEDKEDEDD
jgi:hypothetical protein